MTSLFAARRAAEEFAALVDGTRQNAGSDLPREQLGALTGVVTLLRQQPRVEADPAFVADLRTQLLAAAEVELAPSAPVLRPVPDVHPIRRTPVRQRHLGAAAAAALVVVGSAGAAVAAQGALPGEALYSVKRGIETATVALNTSDAGKGTDLLDQAGTRLAEVEALSAKGADAEAVRSALADFQRTASDGAGLMFHSYQSTGRSSDIAAVRDFAANQLATLRVVQDLAPPGTSADFRDAADTLSAIDTQALAHCAGCGGSSTSLSAFDDATSAASLESLITTPAATPSKPRPAAPAAELASDAEDIADELTEEDPLGPPPVAGPGPTAPPTTTDPGPTQVLEPVQQVVKGVTEPLGGSLIDPVTGLVDQIGQTTGLEGVTDPLTNFLSGLG